jgi:hypothetical protein
MVDAVRKPALKVVPLVIDLKSEHERLEYRRTAKGLRLEDLEP